VGVIWQSTMWMTMVDLLCIIGCAGSGYIVGTILGSYPELSSLLAGILRSMAGFNGIDATAFLTVAGLYVGIVCVLFGLIWQLPQAQTPGPLPRY